MKSSKKFNRAPRWFIVFFCGLSLLGAREVRALDRQAATVVEAVTGDTVRLSGGKMLRYAGLAAPPLQSPIPLVREYGESSLAFNRDLVAGKKVFIEWDNRIRDDRNNLLGYVFLEDGTFVNLEILKAGHAKARSTAPNLKYRDLFRKADLEARREAEGVWREEPKNPFLKHEYVGHVTTKTFYYPTSEELDDIPESQLVYFRSRVEAVAKGYRACSTCREDEQSVY